MKTGKRFRRPRLWLAGWRAWYEGSLINRTAVKGQLLFGAIMLVVCSAAYFMVADQLRNAARERLETVALLEGQRLQGAVDGVLGDIDGLSRQAAVAAGLADPAAGRSRLSALLREYRHNTPEIQSLVVIDRAGRVVAAAEPNPLVDAVSAQRVAGLGRPLVEVIAGPGKSLLRVAFPVSEESGAQLSGSVLATLDLAALVGQAIVPPRQPQRLPLNVVLEDASGLSLFRSGGSGEGEVLRASEAVGGLLPRYGIRLVLTVEASRRMSEAPLTGLALALLAIGVVVTLIIALMVRKMSKTVIQPLAEMSERAMEIAGAGPNGLRELPVTRSDEIGAMGLAFNEMVCSLRQAYDRQEDDVRRRTEELSAARERLSGVLAGIDDMVYEMDPAFSRLDYVSPAVERVFGLTPEACRAAPSAMAQRVDPADRARLMLARRALSVEGAMTGEARYRIRLPDGGVRWLLDRFHLVRRENPSGWQVSGLVRDVTAAVEAESSLLLRDRALASASCGVVITDMLRPGQPILYVNEAFERITGYGADEVMGKNCALLQGGEEGAEQQGVERIREAVAAGEGCKVVLRNYRKDGSPFWNELQLSPLHDERGRVTHYIGIQNDISSAIAATQALVDSEQRLALTIDALHEGVWDWSIPEDRLFTSPSWSGILGIEPQASGAAPGFARFVAQIPEDWADRVRGEIEAHFAGRESDFYLEHPMRRADGGMIWVANHARVVKRAADGAPLRMVGSIVDITQRIESSQQIIGLMSRLDSIFTLSPDAFIYFNESGDVSFVNPAFERLTGIQSGEVAGLPGATLHDLLRQRCDPQSAFPRLDEAMSVGDDGQLMYLLRPVRRVLLVSRRGGREGAAVLYMRDVTRETEVDRMKSEFLTTAAHELRTPMASIMGFAELLMLREFPPERTRDMLSTMHRQARRLTDLVNELLDLARIESRVGKDFNLAAQSIDPIVRDAVAALQTDGDRGRMRLLLADDLPPVEVDPAKMQQAVINLLSNAYKYSPRGGAIEISTLRREKEGRAYVVVVVRDHGIGMTPEQTARVFERFFRADPSGNIPGTGLGMSLVKEIMDNHGGQVEVDSEPDEGTSVSLWIPVHAQAPAGSAGNDAPAANHHGEVILWLDDAPATEHAATTH